jgi:hypothetical protein
MRFATRLVLGLVLVCGGVSTFVGCGGDSKVENGAQVQDAPPPPGVQTSGSQASKPAP